MKRDSFVKGAFVATLCIFIAKFLGLVYVIPFYSLIGEQGGALYAYGYSIYSIFLAISTAGIPTAVSKLVSEYDAKNMMEAKKRVFNETLKIVGFICSLTFILLIVFAPQIAELIIGSNTGGNSIKDIAFIIRCVSLAILVVPFLSATRGYFQGNKFITPTSISEVIEQILRIFILLFGSFMIIKVFNGGLTNAVGISVLGAFAGGLGAYIYLLFLMKKNKKSFQPKSETKDPVSNKAIRKKIISYAIPFIVVNVVMAVYNFSDMVIILRVLTDVLDYATSSAENIISVYTTWGEKFQRIVIAAATGVSISLVPNVVRAFVNKDNEKVGSLFNRALQLIIFVGLPITILISIFAKDVWFLFYDLSTDGPIIIAYSIFLAFINSIMTISLMTLQSLNKYKAVYLSVLIGMVLNACLDAPLILLMDYIGLHPCYGSITASVIGFGISTFIALKAINSETKIKYIATLKMFGKLLISLIVLIGLSFILKYFVTYDYSSKIICFIFLCLYFAIPLLAYIIINIRNGMMKKLFQDNQKINKWFKKEEVKNG